MGKFQDWFKRQKGVVVRTPDDVKAYWDTFEGLHWEEFAAYGRFVERQGRTPADTDPAALLAQAKAPAPAPVGPAPALPPPGMPQAQGLPPLPGAQPPPQPGVPVPAAPPGAAPAPAPNLMQTRSIALGQQLDTLSDRIFAVAEQERLREQAEIYVQQERATQAAQAARVPAAAGGGQGTCTVRLQVQTNFKMKGGTDTLLATAIDNPNGVSAAEVDRAFEQIVQRLGFNRKLTEKLREAYSVHQRNWSTYGVGGSHSVYFTENDVTTAGRPKDGYRLDLENLRVAPGRQNFL